MAGTTATALAIAGIAAGLTGAGVTAYEGVANRDAQSDATKANQAALLQQQQAAANQANLSKQEAVLGQQGQAQAQTGGSLTDSGTSALTDLLAGYPGYQGGSTGAGTSTGTGVGSSGVSGGATPAPSTAGTGTSGTPDITSILAALRNGGSGSNQFGGTGSISGGNWQSQPSAPQSTFELANPVI
jgi:hypothetical protein